MLFAVDVGNTNITVGLFDGKKLIKTFRITTGTARTSDEYGVYFVDWLRVRDIHISEIDAVIIASVVPKVMHSLTSGIIKYLNIQPIIVAPGIKTGILRFQSQRHWVPTVWSMQWQRMSCMAVR